MTHGGARRQLTRPGPHDEDIVPRTACEGLRLIPFAKVWPGSTGTNTGLTHAHASGCTVNHRDAVAYSKV
jgi:hypothetical protein